MLSIAHDNALCGAHELPSPRPEMVYEAQGFKIEALEDGALSTAFGDVNVRRPTTSKGSRHEPVTYWLKVADRIVFTDFGIRFVQLRLRLTGQIQDKLLFRVSSLDQASARAFKVQQQFVADMMAAVPPEARRRLSGLMSAGAT